MSFLAPDAVMALIRAHPMLKTLDVESVDELIAHFQVGPFTQGQTLISAGPRGDVIYLVLSGSLDVFVRQGNRRYRINTVQTGELLGEIAFFDPDAVRSADVVAREDGWLAALTREAYDMLCQEGDPGAEALEKAVLDALAARMQRDNTMIQGLLERHRKGALRRSFWSFFGLR